MTQASTETPMVHYACKTCSMTATCVGNASSALAWLDHMATHAMPDNYDVWTWTAVQLPLS